MITISSAEVIHKLGKAHPFHIDTRPKQYAEIWQALTIEFYDSTDNASASLYPDISVKPGKLFINEKAYDALNELIHADGEVLPVDTEVGSAAILNPLKEAEKLAALNVDLCRKDEWGEIKSIGFHEDKLVGTHIFRSVFDGHMGVFCSEAFKQAVESARLVGIVFSEDLGHLLHGHHPVCK